MKAFSIPRLLGSLIVKAANPQKGLAPCSQLASTCIALKHSTQCVHHTMIWTLIARKVTCIAMYCITLARPFSSAGYNADSCAEVLAKICA